MSLISTANNKFKYDQEYFDIKLEDHAQNSHKLLSDKSGWNYNPLKKGQFGFDNMVMSVGTAFENKHTKLEEIADDVHKGWRENYIFWRDNEPWNNGYFKPYQALGDERRNACSVTEYKSLSQEEKDKDLVIAEYVLKFFN